MLREVEEKGDRSDLDGAIALRPERWIRSRRLLGSDIVMQLDECLRLPAEPAETRARRSCRCAGPSAASAHSKARWRGAPCSASCKAATTGGNAPTAPVRWSTWVSTAMRSAASRSVNRRNVMLAMVEEVAPHLPADRPRYLMGVGTPEDLLEAVARGVDMFDCVLPTRNGRHGLAFTRHGPINLKNARFADDARPVDPLIVVLRWRATIPAPIGGTWRSRARSGHDGADRNQPRLLSRPHVAPGKRSAKGALRRRIYNRSATKLGEQPEGRRQEFGSSGPAYNICRSGQIQFLRECFDAPAPFGSVHRQNTKGRDAFAAARPFFVLRRVSKIPIILFYFAVRNSRRFKTIERFVLPQTLWRPAPNILAAASFWRRHC